MLQNVSKCLGPGLILWHNLSNRKIWNLECYCRVGAIKSVVGELEKYKLDKRLGGKKRDIKWQTSIHSSMEKGMLITT
jgi:hypothetical protein